MLFGLILVLLGLTGLLTVYFRQAYTYWKRKGVGYLEPKIPLGNSTSALPTGICIGIGSKKYYDALKEKGLKFGGIYLVTEPSLVVTDPDYIRDILAKDFQYFVDRNVYANEQCDPLSFHLFSAKGAKWKQLRIKLTPIFTSGKMKMMFQSVLDCSDYMIKALKKNTAGDVEIKEILCRFTTDVIGSVAFGIDCNSFEYPDAEFRKMGKKSFEFDLLSSIRAFLAINMPRLSLKLGIRITNADVSSFFIKIVRDVVDYRRKSGIKRNDFLQILIDLNEDDQKVTFNEIAAQVYLFFIAGFDTSSTTMNFALYELSNNTTIQDKLRQEINIVLARHHNTITYESLSEMEYLEQIIHETLRKYPPVPTIDRLCTKDYTLRDTKISIEKGTPVIISAYGLHMDPQYFPDPERFDPDRFTNTKKSKMHRYVYLPFGEGPRNCIGLKFGLMQSKIGIARIIQDFKLSPIVGMEPVVLDSTVFLLKSLKPVYIKLERV